MGLRIGTNIGAVSINRILAREAEEQTKSYQRLASGQRILSAGDDAAGLAISESLRAQIRSMQQAERNANDGISFIQVAEGGLTEISNILIRLRELGIQAGSDTISDRERGYIADEVHGLVEEVDRISNQTIFNGVQLLNGESSKGILDFQVGIRNTEHDRILFDTTLSDTRSETLGIDGLDFETIDSAREALDQVDESMGKLFSIRAQLGAMQNKLHATVRNLSTGTENLQLARSRIADTDIANEVSQLVKENILQEAGVAVLAQANMSPQLALKLL
ncbi:MAG: flagellin FliC [Bdellovibrio sp.]|nr:flagellin FliC [Bdellovibrio sp.]